MNVFTASNGIGVTTASDGQVAVVTPVSGSNYEHHEWISGRAATALREFFRAEEDERLGRWRWPEHPEYVVYPFSTGDGCTSLSEKTGVSTTFLTRGAARELSSYLAPAALAYFDAHPEPKPWHDAKPGEVWVLTVEGGHEFAARVGVTNEALSFENVAHITSRFDATDRRIAAGRRLWPEVTP